MNRPAMPASHLDVPVFQKRQNQQTQPVKYIMHACAPVYGTTDPSPFKPTNQAETFILCPPLRAGAEKTSQYVQPAVQISPMTPHHHHHIQCVVMKKKPTPFPKCPGKAFVSLVSKRQSRFRGLGRKEKK